MGSAITLAILIVFFALVELGHFRKWVAPEKIHWYDLLVLIALLGGIEGINRWIAPVGRLGHAAFVFGAAWYAVEVIDARPEANRPPK